METVENLHILLIHYLTHSTFIENLLRDRHFDKSCLHSLGGSVHKYLLCLLNVTSAVVTLPVFSLLPSFLPLDGHMHTLFIRTEAKFLIQFGWQNQGTYASEGDKELIL
jgi:hypothetical protein